MPSVQRSIPRTVFLTRLAAPAMLLLTIALAACGSGDASPTATPAASSSPTGTAVSPAATPTPAGSDLPSPAATPGLPTDAVTVVAITPGAALPDRPPAARAISGSSSIELTSGSFVWNGIQADAFRVTTSTDRLTASPGATITVPNPAPLPLAGADAGFVAAIDQPRTTETGRLEWPYSAFTRAGIATIAGDEIRITAPTDPGTYVGTVILRYDDAAGAASQAYYHFLLDVN